MLGGKSCATAAQAWASAGSHTRPGRGLPTGAGASMRSTVVKRSVAIGKHKTSVSLEDAFWRSLKEIAASRQKTCCSLLSEIDQRRQSSNLSSATRVFVLQFYQERASTRKT
jgi:predicted DNA-binding ribbon-helix-helix protein